MNVIKNEAGYGPGTPTTYRGRAASRYASRPRTLGPRDLTGDDHSAIPFILGLLLPDVAHVVYQHPTDRRVVIRFYSLTDRSWAEATWDDDGEPGSVRQDGARSLWTQVEVAFAWWNDQGAPSVDRFGLTVDGTDGAHVAWLDHPDRPVPRME